MVKALSSEHPTHSVHTIYGSLEYFPPVFSFMVTVKYQPLPLSGDVSSHGVGGGGGQWKLCVYPELCQVELKICQLSHYTALNSQVDGVNKAARWLLKSHNREYLLLSLDCSFSKSNYLSK